MRFSWGKIWFGRFAPCKRFDILQLCMIIQMVLTMMIMIYKWYWSWSQSWLGPNLGAVHMSGGRVALPPGRFDSIRKILGHGLLKTSMENIYRQAKMCPNSSNLYRKFKCVLVAENISRVQYKIWKYKISTQNSKKKKQQNHIIDRHTATQNYILSLDCVILMEEFGEYYILWARKSETEIKSDGIITCNVVVSSTE